MESQPFSSSPPPNEEGETPAQITIHLDPFHGSPKKTSFTTTSSSSREDTLVTSTASSSPLLPPVASSPMLSPAPTPGQDGHPDDNEGKEDEKEWVLIEDPRKDKGLHSQSSLALLAPPNLGETPDTDVPTTAERLKSFLLSTRGFFAIVIIAYLIIASAFTSTTSFNLWEEPVTYWFLFFALVYLLKYMGQIIFDLLNRREDLKESTLLWLMSEHFKDRVLRFFAWFLTFLVILASQSHLKTIPNWIPGWKSGFYSVAINIFIAGWMWHLLKLCQGLGTEFMMAKREAQTYVKRAVHSILTYESINDYLDTLKNAPPSPLPSNPRSNPNTLKNVSEVIKCGTDFGYCMESITFIVSR